MVTISIDCDATLLDFHTPFIKYVNQNEQAFLRKIGRTQISLEEITQYMFWDSLGGEPKEWLAVFDRFYKTDEFADLKPVEGAKEAVADLGESYGTIIVSSRPEKLWQTTADNLRRYFHYSFQKDEEIVLTNVRETGKDKVDKILEMIITGQFEISAHIDDDLHVACKCAENLVGAFLFDLDGKYGWNKPENYKSEIIVPEQVIRKTSWRDVVPKLLAEYG